MSTTVNRIAGLALLHGGTASAQGNPQYPMRDKVSDSVIQKYKTTSCQDLAKRHQNPPPAAADREACGGDAGG